MLRVTPTRSVRNLRRFKKNPKNGGSLRGGIAPPGTYQTPLFYSLRLKYFGQGLDVQKHYGFRGTLTEVQESAFCPPKKSEILGKNLPKISGGSDSREVWNLSRDPSRASFGTGSDPLPPSGEEIFGVKVFAFPLNSPKMGGRRGETMVP